MRRVVDSITGGKIRSWSNKYMKVPLSIAEMASTSNMDEIALLIAEKKRQG